MDEGLAIALYTNRLPNYLTVAAIRGRRNKGSYPFDNVKKIHKLTPQIVVAEKMKPTYHTISRGQVRTSNVINELASSLNGAKITVEEAAYRVRAALKENITDKIDLKMELDIHEEALRLALEPRYGLRAIRTVKDLERATIHIEGILLKNSQQVQTAVMLPPVDVMVAGLDINNGLVKPDVYHVQIPSLDSGIYKIIPDDLPKFCIAPSIGGEIRSERSAIELIRLIMQGPEQLSIDEATQYVADSITRTTRESLKLSPTQNIPVDLEVIKVPSDL